MQVVRTFTGAFQANGSGGWQTIGNTEPMTIPENGYLAVYLSNSSDFAGCSHCLASEGDVYFDHLEITFTKGHLKEENGYYPYGLPMAGQSSTALGMTPNRQKYQSNEYITEAGLNWMSFGARQYDPQLGRFLSVDPLAAAGGQESNSPYEAMGDEPVSGTDPGGMLVNNSSNPPIENNVSLALQFAPSTLDIIFGSGSISLDGGENTSDVLDNTDWGTSGSSTAAESEESDADWILNGIMGVENDISSSIAMNEGPGGDGGGDDGSKNSKDPTAISIGAAGTASASDVATYIANTIAEGIANGAEALGAVVASSLDVVGGIALVFIPTKIGDNSEEIKSIHSGYNMNPKEGIPGRGIGGNDSYLHPRPLGPIYSNPNPNGFPNWGWIGLGIGVGVSYEAYELHKTSKNGN